MITKNRRKSTAIPLAGNDERVTSTFPTWTAIKQLSDSDGDISSYNSDDEAMDDNDDDDAEWAAERQRECDEALRKIERNDPTFSRLVIGY